MIERLLPRQHVLIHAVDQRAVEIEKEGGLNAHGVPPETGGGTAKTCKATNGYGAPNRAPLRAELRTRVPRAAPGAPEDFLRVLDLLRSAVSFSSFAESVAALLPRADAALAAGLEREERLD
jgi:hypothetical protein